MWSLAPLTPVRRGAFPYVMAWAHTVQAQLITPYDRHHVIMTKCSELRTCIEGMLLPFAGGTIDWHVNTAVNDAIGLPNDGFLGYGARGSGLLVFLAGSDIDSEA